MKLLFSIVLITAMFIMPGCGSDNWVGPPGVKVNIIESTQTEMGGVSSFAYAWSDNSGDYCLIYTIPLGEYPTLDDYYFAIGYEIEVTCKAELAD